MKKKIGLSIGLVIIFFFVFNAIKIYSYSFKYVETNSDVAIVLGAGTNNGKVSPVFRERINHGIYLYRKGVVKKIIFTGGVGENQSIADSEVARQYAIKEGVPNNSILIEKSSTITSENLKESKSIMDSIECLTALIVSDPLHMKRAVSLAKQLNIECKPSPTQTSMYKTFIPKSKSLIYETFYYSLGSLVGKH